jgi:hypothetical protein
MRLFVIHDRKGDILSFVLPVPSTEGDLLVEAPRGRAVSEVDVPAEDTAEADSSDLVHRLHETLKRHLVKRVKGQATLVPRKRARA